MPSLNNDSNPWDVFNPLSDEFRKADQIFHTELFDYPWRRAAIVVASIIGSLFFIVGAFPVFCWAVKALRPEENKTTEGVDRAAQAVFPKDDPLKAPEVQRVQPNRMAPNEVYYVKGNRWDAEDFKKFIINVSHQGLIFKEVTTDPGPGYHVILFDYWGRPGGDLDVGQYRPFGPHPQAKISIVIGVLSDKIVKIEGVFYITYNPDKRRNPYDEYAKQIRAILS